MKTGREIVNSPGKRVWRLGPCGNCDSGERWLDSGYGRVELRGFVAELNVEWGEREQPVTTLQFLV